MPTFALGARRLEIRLINKIANRDRRPKRLANGLDRSLAHPKVGWQCIEVSVSIFANQSKNENDAVDDRAKILARILVSLAEDHPTSRRTRSLVADRTLQARVSDLVAARVAVCMTQEDVAARMGTKKRVVSRLESGVRVRPTLRTIERDGLAVGASVEIRVTTAR